MLTGWLTVTKASLVHQSNGTCFTPIEVFAENINRVCILREGISVQTSIRFSVINYYYNSSFAPPREITCLNGFAIQIHTQAHISSRIFKLSLLYSPSYSLPLLPSPVNVDQSLPHIFRFTALLFTSKSTLLCCYASLFLPLDLMRGPEGLMSSYLLAAKVAIIIGDTLIVHGAIHTYNMG